MSDSQHSFETRINRFDNALTLINGWADYDPTNTQIKKVTLTALVASIRTANNLVTTTKTTLGNKQTERLLKTFTVREGPIDPIRGSRAIVNIDCLEERILAILDYVKGEDFPKATAAALKRIIKKIRPKYPKKKEGEENNRPSPSEKSFAAAVGYGEEAITLITNLGAGYTPPDANLTVANMTTLVAAIRTLNGETQTALKDYGDANRERRKLYGRQGGLAEVTTQMKGYVASFPGRRNGNKYIEINDALNGN